MGNGVKLPYMKADPNSVTVSGHSMGCYMSEKMMIIHSSTIKGAGLFECMPFGIDYKNELMNAGYSSDYLAALSVDRIDDAVIAGWADDTSNLKNNAVYIFSGH